MKVTPIVRSGLIALEAGPCAYPGDTHMSLTADEALAYGRRLVDMAIEMKLKQATAVAELNHTAKALASVWKVIEGTH